MKDKNDKTKKFKRDLFVRNIDREVLEKFEIFLREKYGKVRRVMGFEISQALKEYMHTHTFVKTDGGRILVPKQKTGKIKILKHILDERGLKTKIQIVENRPAVENLIRKHLLIYDKRSIDNLYKALLMQY